MGEEKREELSSFQKKMCKFIKQSAKSSGLAFSGEENDGNGDDKVVDVAEDTVKKRKRRKISTEKEGIEEGLWQLRLQDPLSVLGSDIMHVILSYLDARSVPLCLLVSRGWHGVACTDRLWSSKQLSRHLLALDWRMRQLCS